MASTEIGGEYKKLRSGSNAKTSGKGGSANEGEEDAGSNSKASTSRKEGNFEHGEEDSTTASDRRLEREVQEVVQGKKAGRSERSSFEDKVKLEQRGEQAW